MEKPQIIEQKEQFVKQIGIPVNKRLSCDIVTPFTYLGT